MTPPESSDISERADAAAELRQRASGLVPPGTIALVGLMGAGKTTIGRRLAAALQLPFVDADDAIVQAAGRSIEDIFAERGECEFRRGERNVISRLLAGPVHVLATGGGAFIDPGTRTLMKERAISIWLRAPLEVLMKRVVRRDHRPLLKEDDPEAVMQRLINDRYPIYAEADMTIDSGAGPHNTAVASIIDALRARLEKQS